MKTEPEVLARIQELEEQNKLLAKKDQKIVAQEEIDQQAMGVMLENQKQIKKNETFLEALKWVVGSHSD
ncbi:hypothetical protein AHMF7605_11345 [Adhaeribacter arboris]|uniref:Uncharacterized protein n=1 Tax=Adhaeribacter arboris TaxID=2072846 RepID=A0A2T2YEZ1_9BACT|nr:hypothetical protein [Adhaeribacter arboris]PSR54072.1 hypothetical protein AHMF7605_11345 [Adhaeribacter arboris]